MDLNVTFRCRKCRLELFVYPETTLLSTHGYEIVLKNNNLSVKLEYEEVTKGCKVVSCSQLDQELLYVDETTIPNWMRLNLDSGQWTKGKFMCPRCNARVGSFDFVSGFHCNCKISVIPPIRFVKSKIDTVLLNNDNKT